ncbi:hypothetical protein [Exiguobacterium undae]|uniref:Uncharacterized protein n=1 Tax=Exiguobacterium undae TaxID=169177 RepID=A0ABX2V8H7_9BACL|nr:hypothetical protein [Exiguobacterium undae]OAN13874.1 hypothetical protein A3783_16390 [Exiguobacterium undae]
MFYTNRVLSRFEEQQLTLAQVLAEVNKPGFLETSEEGSEKEKAEAFLEVHMITSDKEKADELFKSYKQKADEALQKSITSKEQGITVSQIDEDSLRDDTSNYMNTMGALLRLDGINPKRISITGKEVFK